MLFFQRAREAAHFLPGGQINSKPDPSEDPGAAGQEKGRAVAAPPGSGTVAGQGATRVIVVPSLSPSLSALPTEL